MTARFSHLWYGLVIGYLPLVIAFLLYTLYATRLFSFTPDDAFIFFRYADNWAAGLGPVYNIGERVQGYTSFLWLAWITILNVLRLPTESAAKLSGLFCGLGTILISWQLGRHVYASRLGMVLTPILLVSFLNLPYWSVSGMDTPLFALLLTAAIWLYLESWQHAALRPLVGLAFGLTLLARPEGLLFATLTVVFEMVRVRLRPARGHLLGFLLFCSILLSYYAWSYLYYGDPLPNT